MPMRDLFQLQREEVLKNAKFAVFQSSGSGKKLGAQRHAFATARDGCSLKNLTRKKEVPGIDNSRTLFSSFSAPRVFRL